MATLKNLFVEGIHPQIFAPRKFPNNYAVYVASNYNVVDRNISSGKGYIIQVIVISCYEYDIIVITWTSVNNNDITGLVSWLFASKVIK